MCALITIKKKRTRECEKEQENRDSGRDKMEKRINAGHLCHLLKQNKLKT